MSPKNNRQHFSTNSEALAIAETGPDSEFFQGVSGPGTTLGN
jgi:hypothetical protein